MPGKIITKDQWAKVMPPFSFVKLTNTNDVEREIMLKWLKPRCGGWIYHDGDAMFVFERKGDAMMFRIWLECQPFENDGFIDDA